MLFSYVTRWPHFREWNYGLTGTVTAVAAVGVTVVGTAAVLVVVGTVGAAVGVTAGVVEQLGAGKFGGPPCGPFGAGIPCGGELCANTY